MCLYKAETSYRIAKEPVPVYKILTRDNLAPFNLFYRYSRGMNTPYGHPDYHCTGRSGELSDREPLTGGFGGGVVDSLHGGYLHAYLAPRPSSNPYWFKGWEGDDETDIFKTVKMYIPAGAGYWIGMDGDVASTALYWDPEEQ